MSSSLCGYDTILCTIFKSSDLPSDVGSSSMQWYNATVVPTD
jgi:hypothetical protein